MQSQQKGLEYRLLNPFGTDVSEEAVPLTTKAPRAGVILQTCAVAFVATLFVLVLLYVLFAMGDSMVAGT